MCQLVQYASTCQHVNKHTFFAAVRAGQFPCTLIMLGLQGMCCKDTELALVPELAALRLLKRCMWLGKQHPGSTYRVVTHHMACTCRACGHSMHVLPSP